MNDSMQNAFSEVYVVIENFPLEYQKKIPAKFMNYIEKSKNNDYNFEYDFNKTLMEQNLSEDAKDIIAYLYMTFINNKIDKVAE